MSVPDQEQGPLRQLVVIGSSAGGIDALSTLVATLPPDFPAPIVIAQHLDPKRASALHTILERRSTLPVRIVEEHAPLEAGVIYVVPANRHIFFAKTGLELRIDGIDRPIPSVDLLLETAAATYGEHLIAVILTGMGSDGAAGAQIVKRLGGTVVIQNPDTAAHPAMPRSLDPASVDVVADLARIGPILYDLLLTERVAARPADEQAFGTFLEQVRERYGIDFSSYKQPTIRRRLQHRIVATNTEDLAGYMAYLDEHPQEYQQLVSSFLIKVTDFFRDPELFAYLRETVLPELIAHAEQHDRELRIWSAGCATGEEAYSLAILVAELLEHKLDGWTIRIFATDLDVASITFARQGIYSVTAVRGLPADLIARCFSIESGTYQVRKHIRALTVFGQHDLGQRAPFPRIDLILCRNVLIYFTQTLQQRALRLFAYSLRDHGALVLGKSETTSPLAEFFALQHHQFKVYRRHGERITLPVAPMRFPSPPVPLHPVAPSRIGPGRAVTRLGGRDEQNLLRLPVGMVVVNRRYDIQAINGIARRLLTIYNAALGDDLIHIASGVPDRLLREAIDRTFRSGSPTNLRPFAVNEAADDGHRSLQITCYPQRAEDDQGPIETVLLIVNDVTNTVQDPREHDETETQGATAPPTSPETRVTQQAQQITRLLETNRHLLEANQEFLSTNDELRFTNDEFLLSMEEAQASTEEIETLNEEMQATNEELETLNEELQATVEELNTTNDELHARTLELQGVVQVSEEERARLKVILDTMGDAILVLRQDGTTLLANAAFERLFARYNAPYAVDDLEGHPLPLGARPHERALRGEPFSMEFTVAEERGERRWFETNSHPVLDAAGRLQWSILAIRDTTDRSMHRLQEQFISLASHELRTPLTSLQGYLQLLDRRFTDPPLPDRARQYVTNSLGQVDRLKRLITDLLDVVRLQNGKLVLALKPIPLQPVVAQAVELAHFLTDRPIRLAVPDDPADPIVLDGDAGRLEQVLLNLLTNAITHAPEGDHIDVRLRRVGSEAEIAVQDYGAGIAPADIPNLFSRFYQGARAEARRGLGLGLFIVQELVAAHGGTVTVASTLGEGSTFTVRLPLLAGDARD